MLPADPIDAAEATLTTQIVDAARALCQKNVTTVSLPTINQ